MDGTDRRAGCIMQPVGWPYKTYIKMSICKKVLQHLKTMDL